MSDREINIAIAEACGWKDLEIEDFSEYGVPVFMLMGSNNTGTRLAPPDYCNDLNAMHEAEKVLLSEFGNLAPYNKHLAYATCASGEPRYHATARQRAEAFLRTIGKWKEAAK